MNDSMRVRAELFGTTAFREQLVEDLGLAAHSHRIIACLDFLLEDGRLPSSTEGNTAALAADAALIIASIGSMQTTRESVLSVTGALCAMKLDCAVTSRAEIERPAEAAPPTFAADLTALFPEYWAAPRGAFLQGLCHTAVSIFKSDPQGARLFGVLDRWSAKRKQFYTNGVLPFLTHPALANFVSPEHGGLLLMPAAIANFAELLEASVAGTVASIGTRRRTEKDRRRQ